METRWNWKRPMVFITMVLLIVSNSKWLAQLGIEAVFEYGAYFLMLCGVFFSFLTFRCSRKTLIRNVLVFFVVSVLFCVGIAVQGLSIGTRLKLMATMLVISSMILAENYMNSWETIRAGAYGILCGCAVTTLISLLAGVSLMETVYEGFMALGFTGGVQYKNFFGAFMLGTYMSLFLYHRYCRKLLLDRIVMGVVLMLIFVSSARATYIFLAVFLLTVNLDRIVAFVGRSRFYQRLRLSRVKRALLLTAVFAVVLCGGVFVISKVLSSGTYAFRLRGVRNYLTYAWGDWYHLIFGNAQMAWSGLGEHYVRTIQIVVGMDGTYEMGFINTLIKNGILGLIGFAVMYIHMVRVTMGSEKQWPKVFNLSVLSVLLVSSLVESFVCNIHSIFGVYCYLMMAGVCGMSRPELQSGQGVTLYELVMEKWHELKRPRDTKES